MECKTVMLIDFDWRTNVTFKGRKLFHFHFQLIRFHYSPYSKLYFTKSKESQDLQAYSCKDVQTIRFDVQRLDENGIPLLSVKTGREYVLNIHLSHWV